MITLVLMAISSSHATTTPTSENTFLTEDGQELIWEDDQPAIIDE